MSTLAKSLDQTEKFGAREEGEEGIVRCHACPVICRIRPGRAGACSRYANEGGALVRTDPIVLTRRLAAEGGAVRPFLDPSADWDGALLPAGGALITGIGAGTTYPDYKPAPFIVSGEYEGVDTVTVVTEGIFSYCGVKAKIDTDRHLGEEASAVRVEGERIGHVTTGEYGSQMLSLGGVRHLTGGSKAEGNATCEALLRLCNREAVELKIDGGASLVLQAGEAPIVDGVEEKRMRVGCGSAAIGMFARQFHGLADEVVVVDDHITGVLSEHQAGKFLGMKSSGLRLRGRKSTPGRIFQVADAGTGFGGTTVKNPLDLIQSIDRKLAWPGLRVLFTSTTGEDAFYCELDEELRPVPAALPEALANVVSRIGENCEKALASLVFMAGAGGSLRAGVTENPVLLTREIHELNVRVTMGGAPVYLWPGGGITVMVDVTQMPGKAFGSVPTPALVAPIEFTMPRAAYQALGGHMDEVVPLSDVVAAGEAGSAE